MRTILSVGLGSFLVLVGSARAQDAFRPDGEGIIRDWLVLAPLPFGDAQIGQEALAKEELPHEANLHPRAGDKVKIGDLELTWKKHHCKGFLLDLNAFLGKLTERSVAYAVCYLVTDQKMPGLTMKIGCDDWAKVYLNGKEVLREEEVHPADKDQRCTPNLTLVKGTNTIVFKIVNGNSDWGGCLRFIDKGGKPAKNLKVTLAPTGK